MAQQDVENTRAAYEAFGRGDVMAAIEAFADDVEWWTSESLPNGGLIRGKDNVLDAWSQAVRLPDVPCFGERIERFAVREVADRVHGNREAVPGRARNRVHELFLARDLHTGAVEQSRGLRAERSVHERLHVAEPQQLVAEA